MFLLALLVAIGYVIWAYRKKSAEKAVARKKRYQQLFAADPMQARPGAEVLTGTTTVASPSVVRETTRTAAYRRKERLLGPEETVLYYVLRAGLPDHEVFGRMNLSALLEVPSVLHEREREQRTQRLSLHYVDFVVCDKGSGIVAAVDLESAAGDSTGGSTFKLHCLTGAGIRYVQIKAAAIPRKEDVKALIYGAVN